MLRSLDISNYALINKIHIEFGPGLNIITGETGAGKSIIMGALSLLLGGRADTKTVRDQQRKAVVEATFAVAGNKVLAEVLKANDIDVDPEECVLRREIAAAGRSRTFVNDTPVLLPVLREVALLLIDIHSQHQNLLLADAGYQLSIIDSLADNSALFEDYTAKYQAYRTALKKYSHVRNMIEQDQKELEYRRFQLEELLELNPQPSEQEQLEQEEIMLENATVIKARINSALAQLTGAQVNALQCIAQTENDLRQLREYYPAATEMTERLESVRIEVKDIAETLTDYDAALNPDPMRLEYVRDRLSSLYGLEEKHHVDTVEALIAIKEQLEAWVNDFENAGDNIKELETDAKRAKRCALEAASRLSDARKAQAEAFSNELRECALPLGMKNFRCEIQFTTGKLQPTGTDNVEFMFAFNKNQPLMPVGQTASGGEISRLMLSVKAIVARRMQLPTIVFDEVDTGVSGDVAVRMATLMAEIAQTSQVIAITHLPAVAAKGKTHFKVYKEDDETSTNTHIRQLAPDERVDEIALMLSGDASAESARAAATTLLNHG